MKKKKIIKAPALRKGDTVGLIAPGSPVPEHRIDKAINQIQQLGFNIKMGKHTYAKNGYLAGTDQQRLEDLHRMVADPLIKGIWCLRGGYGCTRLLPDLDYKLICKHPKVLIGYSDITALLQAIHIKTGLVVFHGPVGVSDFNDYVVQYINQTLMNPDPVLVIQNFDYATTKETSQNPIEIIYPGIAKGRLIGGNLSLIAAMAGTDYDWDVKNKLIFLEDIGEKPYRIDRMLTQILQTHKLNEAAGIVLGTFKNCEAKKGEASFTLLECLKDRLTPLKIPIIYGMSFGHIDHQFILPIGIEAELNTATQTIRLLEAGVSK